VFRLPGWDPPERQCQPERRDWIKNP